MMKAVKCSGAPGAEPPKPVAKADFGDQGSIPYGMAKAQKTPDIGSGRVTRGTKRGMGAALRGSRFTSA